MEKIKRRDPVQTEIQKVHVISPNDAVGALAYVMDPAQMKRAMQSIIKLDPENGKQRIFYAATKVAFPGRSDSHDEENGGEEGQDDSIEKLDMTGSPGEQGKLEEDGDLEEYKVAEEDDEENEDDQEDDEEATLDLLAPVVTKPNRRTATASPTKRTIANPALTKKASSPTVPKGKRAHKKTDSTDSGFKDINPSKRRK